MPKILLITLEYPPDRGGIARYLGNLYSRLPPENTLVLAPRHPESEKFDSQVKYKIYRRRLSVGWLWPRWRIIGWQAVRIILREKISEIHLSHVMPVGYIALVFKKIFGISYVVYTHGLDVLRPQESRWKKFWLKIILQNASRVIANSEFTKNEILKLGSKKNIKVIYPCVKALSSVHSNILQNVGMNLAKKYSLEEKKIILSVGRLVARKGFDKIIEAMPRILQEVPEAAYIIVGDGPYRKELRKMSNVKCQMSNVFISDASDDELYAWYEICDVFAMPARQIGGDAEGFGIVFLEAALHGKPSVGGRSGGVPEAIEDGKTGILVDPNNVDEIAEALVRLLKDDKLTRKLGQAAQERVLNQFICRNMGEAPK